MLADIISRVLVMVLGYAYPAFQCFKAVEKNKVEIEELRFWCQYWIIVALLAVVERISDIFISWVPMYAEIKLAIFLYMWYPKTKGTGFIYETLLRPFVAKHETDIERSLQELRTRAWDLAIYYYHNCTELGQTKFFQVIDYLTSQSGRIKKGSSEKGRKNDKSKANAPPPPDTIFSFNNQPPAHTPPLYSQLQESQFNHFVDNQQQFDRPDHHGSRFGFRHRKGSH
ncbi:hypothetical protein POM88_017861 [Heracleum sosnowskyi]|uniref:HVA22-like protein n=1 Tax=Heracleum sosnowskyi TaxID=360622 RepID=A0AAD8IRH4_9APIA|nr:hypothetical protein POM88_017861 [Heracleum sosnowskyi]